MMIISFIAIISMTIYHPTEVVIVTGLVQPFNVSELRTNNMWIPFFFSVQSPSMEGSLFFMSISASQIADCKAAPAGSLVKPSSEM